MIKNNKNYITVMEDETDTEGNLYTDYTQKLASDVDNIFAVNNSAYQQEALVEYEREKATISEKEARIDTRMQNLETEQSAVNKMIEGRENMRDENFERHLNIFG